LKYLVYSEKSVLNREGKLSDC